MGWNLGMLEAITLPLSSISGIGSALTLFFALVIGHAFADFPLQGDFLSHGKNRHSSVVRLADGKANPGDLWVYLMSAHCLIHSGFVFAITGMVVLAVAEFVLHFLIDVLKCEGRTSFALDQWLHVLCKAGFVVVIWLP